MSENVEKTIKRVEKYNAQGKYEASIELLKPLLQEHPDNIQLVNIMGASCDLAGKKFMAVNYFHKSADYYFEKKFYDKALAVYKKILKVHPDDARSYECSAKIIEANGNFNEAAASYKSAAIKYHQDGNNEKAVALFKEAVKLAPFDQRLKLELIELYKKLGETGKAIEMYLDFADNFIAKGDFAGARTILENILKLDSENIDALKQLAVVAEKLGDKEQTLAARQKILSYDPENTEALYSFAIQYYERFADVENTVNMLKKAHRLQPEKLEILLKLKELSPKDLEVRQALKVYYLDHNDKKSAVEEILGIADLFELSKNRSMADKLRSKANEMLREIDLNMLAPGSSLSSKEKVVSLDSLTSSRFINKEIQENAETNPYFAGLLVQENQKEPVQEIKPVYEKDIQVQNQSEMNQNVISQAPKKQEQILKASPLMSENPPLKEKPKPVTVQPVENISISDKMDFAQNRPPSGAEKKVAPVIIEKPAPTVPKTEKMPSAPAAVAKPQLETEKTGEKRSVYQTTKEHQIIIDNQHPASTELPVAKIVSQKEKETAKVIPLDVVVSDSKAPDKYDTVKETALSSVKVEEEESESIIIENVDIDPNTLTIKVSTSDIKPDVIDKKMKQAPVPAEKIEAKVVVKEVAEKELVAEAAIPVEEHKDVSILLDKLPDEHPHEDVEKDVKFQELKPEITKEILEPVNQVPQVLIEKVIPPPKFLKERMDIKVVQLSKGDPLKASSEKLSAKDDSPEIFLQLTDIDEIEKVSHSKQKLSVSESTQKTEVTKKELQILEQTTPVVQEQRGFDIQNVIKNIKISDDVGKSPEKSKKLFSDNTLNLSLQMDNIFNSMINDTVVESVDDDETRFNLGLSYMEMGLHDDAIAEFRSVVDKKNYTVRSVRCLALAYSHKQDSHEALKWYVKSAELLPPDSEERMEALYSAGDLCLSLNDYANAQKYLMEIYRQNPTYHGVIEKLEIINSKNRKLEQA